MKGATDVTEDALWAFALQFYSRPAVTNAFLLCQDEFGADINILLLFLWRASQGYALTDFAVTAAEESVHDWRTHVLLPLRQIRRWIIKGETDAFRKQIANAEIEAERIALKRLSESNADLEKGFKNHSDAMVTSILRYEKITGQKLPSDAVQVFLENL